MVYVLFTNSSLPSIFSTAITDGDKLTLRSYNFLHAYIVRSQLVCIRKGNKPHTSMETAIEQISPLLQLVELSPWVSPLLQLVELSPWAFAEKQKSQSDQHHSFVAQNEDRQHLLHNTYMQQLTMNFTQICMTTLR